MKHLIKQTVKFLLVLAVVSIAMSVGAFAQLAQHGTYPIWTSDSYANSNIDTSAGLLGLGSYGRVTLYISCTDSMAADVYVQYKAEGGSWATAYTDSLINTTNAGTVKEIVLRNNTVERIPNFGQVRVIKSHRASANGFTSPLTTFKYQYSK